MYLSFITGNILQKFSTDKKNIIYYPQNNMFDHSLFILDQKNHYYILDDHKTTYDMPNVVALPKNYMSLYNYNLSITNNIIGYSTSNIKRFHINSIIFTHSYRPHFIKKEDASILNSNLSREIKVFFSSNTQKSWGLKGRSYFIKYGIPHTFNILNDQDNRNKDILILNFDRAMHNNQLLSILKNNTYNCDCLDSCQTSTTDLNSILNQYKICIDLADHNIFNLLCSIAAGCKAITLKTPMISNDYSNTPGLYIAESPAEIIDLVSNLISNKTDIKQNSADISSIFSFDEFQNNITNFVDTVNQEAFIL
jgi:hypothetical protein